MDHRRDLLGLGEATQRGGLPDAVEQLGVQVPRQLGQDEAGRDGVAGDAPRPQFLGYSLGQADEASLGRVTTYESPISTGVHLGRDIPATKVELLGLFEHLEGELDRLGFFFPPEKAAGMKVVLRNFWSRMPLTRADAQILHGILRQMVRWKDRG